MTKVDAPLSEEELRQISAIVEALDRSSLTFLQLQIGDMSLTIGKGDAPLPAAPAAVPAPVPAPRAPAPAAPTRPAAGAQPAAGAPAAGKPPSRREQPVEDGTTPIVAPSGGRFYAKPDPGAPPFVSVGAEIDESTTVALIEVMKVFNAIPAGVSGVIAQVCVEDAQIVEAGQPLFRVRAKS